jgi:hypothetical protein
VTDQEDRDAADRLIRRLQPIRKPPRARLPVFKIPDHHLLVTRDGSRYVVGSASPRGLFDEVVDRLVADEVTTTGTLAAHRTIERGRALEAGSIEVFVRSTDPLIGGTNAIVADLDGDRLMLRHRGEFDESPFVRPRTALTWDTAPLAAFERNALVAVAEPADIGGGRLWRYVESLLRWPLVGAELGDLLGDCRILALGEVEGRLEEHGTDMLIPAGVLALEIEGSGADAEAALDTSVIHIVDRMNNLSEGSFLIETPSRREMQPGAPRHIDLEGAGQLFSGGFPIMRSASLDWTVAVGPNGSFCLVSSHPQQLADAARAIRETPAAEARPGDWSSCGTMNGRALHNHLHSYVGQPKLLTPDHDPQSLDDVRATMTALSSFAGGIERCRWQLRRPCDRTVELEVQITLTGRDSAGPRTPRDR